MKNGSRCSPTPDVKWFFGFPAGALQLSSGGSVQEVFGVRVLLQVRSCYICRNRTIDGLVYDGCLLLAPCHQTQFLGVHDGGYTHGDSVAGYILETAECGGGVRLGKVIQVYLAGAGGVIGTRLVEADVTGATDAENLQIKTTAGLNLVLISLAVGFDVLLCNCAAGKIDVLGGNVDVVEQVGVHEVPVGLNVLTGQTVVFVKVEGSYILEGKTLFLVQTNQLCIETKRGSAGGQTKHYTLALCGAAANELCYFCCQCLDSFLLCCENFVSHGDIILYYTPVKSILKCGKRKKLRKFENFACIICAKVLNCPRTQHLPL